MQKMFWLRATNNGTTTDELLQVGASGHKRIRNMLKRIQVLEGGRIFANEARNWKLEGQKRRKGYKKRKRKIVE